MDARALLILLPAIVACAPEIRSLQTNNGRTAVQNGPLPLSENNISVLIWAGKAGDDPEIARVDGVDVASASTNNRLELAPGAHSILYRAAWKVGDVRGGARYGRWGHEPIEVTEAVMLDAGHCYFPRQLKAEKMISQTSNVTTGATTSQGVSWATEPAHLVDAQTDPRHFGSKNICARSVAATSNTSE